MVPNFALNKAVPHGFEQSCSDMTTQKLGETVQQHNEGEESSQTGCRSLSRARISRTPRSRGRVRRTEELTVYERSTPSFWTQRAPPSRSPRDGGKAISGDCLWVCHRQGLPYRHIPHASGPIHWARGDVGLKPSAAARP